ncbi:hypothetical protein B0J11DRAFT_426442 [Dendryphion nanum]|uniref:SET domain-containing protein n=1 Tax=Dendryphion nanum TaxID=256645 RepID=A0A9P9EAS3_9PLEO|nr:hypothetical protein B0J11DRAFT_426442 [Dendryphion nanum]
MKAPEAPENPYYTIHAIPGKGYGCFATTNIKRGTRILTDTPLLIVKIADYLHSDVQKAFDALSPNDQALYFSLHSAHGQSTSSWPPRIHDSVGIQERRRIEEQHDARVGPSPSLVSIFQTNCMEMEGGAAVFAHAARFNHSCNPNATFTWNPTIRKETIHTITDIAKDDQITLAYIDIVHDKATRLWELKHYGFVCDCAACSGDDSDPKSFAAQSAERRFRLDELNEGLKRLRGPYLEIGARDEGFIKKMLEFAKLLREEGHYTARLADTYLDIALVAERNGDYGTAKICALNALRVKIDSQGRDFPEVPKYESVVRRIKGLIKLSQEVSVNNGR